MLASRTAEGEERTFDTNYTEVIESFDDMHLKEELLVSPCVWRWNVENAWHFDSSAPPLQPVIPLHLLPAGAPSSLLSHVPLRFAARHLR